MSENMDLDADRSYSLGNNPGEATSRILSQLGAIRADLRQVRSELDALKDRHPEERDDPGEGDGDGDGDGNGGKGTRRKPVPSANTTAQYSAAAIQMGLLLWASPDLRKGASQFLPLLPAAMSVMDNWGDKGTVRKAAAPAALGTAGTLLAGRIFK